MARNKKSVLNQKTEEPKVEAAKLLAPEIEPVEPIVGWVNPELEQNSEEIVEKMIENKTKIVEESKEISLKVSGEKLSEVLQKKEVVEKEEVIEKVDETPRPAGIRSLNKETLNHLTHRERRFFQRTGILPK